MATLDFPANPTVGQEYAYPPFIYKWDGVKWKTTKPGSSPDNDSWYVNVTGDTMTGALTLPQGRSLHIQGDIDGSDNDPSLTLSTEAGYAMLWRNPHPTLEVGKSQEFIGIDSGSDLRFRQDKGLGDLSYTDHYVYHQGYKPTAVDVGALALTGGTLTGALTIATGADAGQLKFGSDNQLFLTASAGDLYLATNNGRLIIDGLEDPVVRVGSTDHRIYHEGFKPTAVDVGALPNITILPGGSNLDTIMTTGFYNLGGGNINTPYVVDRSSSVFDDAQLIVSFGDGTGCQILLEKEEGRMWTRTYNQLLIPPAWNSWTFIYSDQDPPTPADVGAVAKTGDTMTGDITFTTKGKGLKFTPSGMNDYGGVRFNQIGTDSNAGELELYTTDDSSEPIVFRSYETSQVEPGVDQSYNWASISNKGVVSYSGFYSESTQGRRVGLVKFLGTHSDARSCLVILAKKYISTALNKTGFVGRVYFDRGVSASTNMTGFVDISVATAYTTNQTNLLMRHNLSSETKIVEVTYNGEVHYALYKAAISSENVFVEGLSFDAIFPVLVADATNYTLTDVDTTDYMYHQGNPPTALEVGAASIDKVTELESMIAELRAEIELLKKSGAK